MGPAFCSGLRTNEPRSLTKLAQLAWFFSAMAKGHLGRKRLLDPLLAGTLRTAGVHSILTLNSADFGVFDEFECVPIG